MRRLHVDDLIGHVIEQEPWTQINLPAIAEVPQRVQIGPDRFIERKPDDLLHPERESRGTLARTKDTARDLQLLGSVPAISGPAGRRHDPVALVRDLR